jgi:hypothetical protein
MQPILSFLFSGLLFALFTYGIIRLGMALSIRNGRKMMEEINATLARATHAMATVVQIQQPSGIMRKPRIGSVHVLLTLDVHPPSGDSYQTCARWQVDMTALPQVQPGHAIPVQIDANTRTTIYPGVPWATYTWA